MLAMTRAPHPTKVLLIADPRRIAPSGDGVSVRRYRIARIRFAGQAVEGGSRFEHLRHVYD